MVIFLAYERSDGLDEVGKLYVTDVSCNNNAGEHLIRDVTDDNGEGFSSEFVMGQAAAGGHRNEAIGRMEAQHGPEEQGVKTFWGETYLSFDYSKCCCGAIQMLCLLVFK